MRKLKGEKASKEKIQAAVAALLALKGEYKKLTGNEGRGPHCGTSVMPGSCELFKVLVATIDALGHL